MTRSASGCAAFVVVGFAASRADAQATGLPKRAVRRDIPMTGLTSANVRFWLALALIGLTAVAPRAGFAQADKKIDVSGTWTFSVTTDAGTGTPTVTLKQQGDSLTGHYSSQVFGEVALKGTVKDNRISFSFVAQVQDQSLTVTYTGTVEAADAMKGTVDLGGFGSGTFTAKRQ